MVSSHQRHHPLHLTATPQRTMAAETPRPAMAWRDGFVPVDDVIAEIAVWVAAETPRRAMAWRDGFVPVVGLTAGVGNRVAESQVYHGDTETRSFFTTESRR